MHSTIAADVVNGNDFVSARHFREYGVKDLNWRLNGYAAKNIDGQNLRTGKTKRAAIGAMG